MQHASYTIGHLGVKPQIKTFEVDDYYGHQQVVQQVLRTSYRCYSYSYDLLAVFVCAWHPRIKSISEAPKHILNWLGMIWCT